MATIVRVIIANSSPAISKNRAICLVPTTTTYALANTANLALAGGVVAGVALEAAAPGASTAVQIDGTLAGVLAAGDYSAVTSDANGVLTRISAWDATCFAVVDTLGNVTLDLGSTSGTISAGGGVQYTATGAVGLNQVVCSAGAGHVQVATLALVLAGNAIVGLATAAASNGAVVPIAPLASTVANSVTGLGAGAATRVGIAWATATPVRVAKPIEGFELGLCDTSGNVTIQPRTPVNVGPMAVMTPDRFGAYPNDPTRLIENLAAFNAMSDYLGTVGAPYSLRILINDKYYLADSWRLRRYCHIEGIMAGTSTGRGQLIVPRGTSAIVSDYVYTSTDGGSSYDSTVENLELISQDFSTTTTRANLTSYAINTWAALAGESRYKLLCTTAGTSAASLPAGLTSLISNASVTDGTVVWRVVSNAGNNRTIKIWAPNTVTAVGDMVRGRFDPAYTYVCIAVAGNAQTGATKPTTIGDTPIVGFTFTDGNVTWRTDIYSGIHLKAALKCKNIYVYGFANCGISATGSSTYEIPPTNCNNSIFESCNVQVCGGGYFVHGSDSNIISIINCKAQNLGFGQDGQCGVGLLDAALFGTRVENFYTEAGNGPSWICQSTARSTYISCRGENYALPRYLGGSTAAMNCDFPDTGAGAALTNVSTGRFQNVVTNDVQSGISILTQLDENSTTGGCYLRSTDDDNIKALAWKFEYQPASTYKGWALRRYVGAGWANTGFGGWGESHAQATEGPGHSWIPFGYYSGLSYKRYIAEDAGLFPNVIINGGKRAIGDLYRNRPYATNGDWAYDAVTTAGTTGSAWAGTTAYATDKRYNYKTFGNVVISGTKAFKCTRGGTSQGSTPNWASLTGYSTKAPRAYTNATRVAISEYFRPSTAGANNGHAYKVSPPTAWSASLTVGPNQIITPSVPNDHYYYPDIPKWTPSTGALVGQLFQPTLATDPAFGRVYMVVDAQIAGVPQNYDYGGGAQATGSSEPTWNLVGGQFYSGSCIMQEVTLVTGATEPKWFTDAPASLVTTPEAITVQARLGSGAWPVKFNWKHIYLTTRASGEPTWPTGAGATVKDTAWNYPADESFGLTWVEAGTEAASNVLAEGGGSTVEWTLVDDQPITKYFGRVEDTLINYELRAKSQWGRGGGGAGNNTPANPNATSDTQRDYLATTDATANQIAGSIVVPTNSTVSIDGVVVAKLQGAAGSARWNISNGIAENVSGTVTITAAPTVALVGAFNGLSTLLAGAVTVAVNGTAINVRVTGIAATNIHWAPYWQQQGVA